ncbi:MAG: OmpH family outer membrane protein [Acidobacteriota bacterium]
MNRLLAFVLMLASGFALSAAAQTPAAPRASASHAGTAPAAKAPAGPAKIAVIAFQIAVAQTNEGQRDFADLQKKFDPKRQELKTLGDQVDAMTKQLQADGAKLTDAQRQAQANAIDTKKKQLERNSEDAQSDFQQQMQEVYNTLASKVYDVMENYAQEKGFTLVLDISSQQTPVLYANAATNITKDVVDAYNAKSGVPAPAAAPQAGGLPSAPTPAPAARPAAH